ncbi:Hpt domain-containing protein [Dyadobacter jejuensis]|uniref:histidine kinase n=1 Tax=Dyadobacter jejuensis TaxID=1082580 RepID=A0A316AQ04_9BACT|nr:ATP-binding protein [Dyadobacter jejuensis]PWJ59568.1 Hpt domain-containing protein [Dyadobacter jejuensis]
MSANRDKSILSSVKGKVLLGFMVAAMALGASWIISKIAFENMLVKLEQLTKPNEKLHHINQVFKEIVLLEHLQNEPPGNTNSNEPDEFLKHSERLLASLDTLSQLNIDDPKQIIRIDSMRSILRDREQIFGQYMAVRKNLVSNKDLSSKVRTISGLITTNKKEKDSTVVKTEKKVTTTTVYTQEPQAPQSAEEEEEDKKGFLTRLFKSKKQQKKAPEPVEPKTVRKQEVNVTIDTVKIAKQDNTIEKVGEAVHAIEKSQRRRTNQFVDREKQLAMTGSSLVSQLLMVMQNIEQDAIQQSLADHEQTQRLVTASMKRIEWVMIGFFLLTLLVAYFIFADITRSNDYRRQLEEAKEEAEYHSMAKQRFLSNMSHEIRTPLQSIIGYTEVLKSADKPKKQDFDTLHAASEHLLHLVNDILDYSRIISNQFSFEKRNFAIGQVLEEVTHMLSPTATAKSLKFKVYNQLPSDIFLESDPFRLRQILYNLLSNAIKFTTKGEVALKVTGKQSGAGYRITFEVTDTGIGLTKEQIQRVFNQFEQADASISRQYGGSGLGLSIVKSLVEGMNGKITVRSQLGKGTVFAVTLHMKKGSPVLKGSKDKARKYHIDGKVWLIDDDAFILKWCSTVLHKEGIDHSCFSSAEEALEAPWDDQIRYVLTDMRMSGMSGAELCQTLKQRTASSVKYYVLTAQALPEEQEKLLQEGFDGLLMKPFHTHDLLALLDTPSQNKELDSPSPSPPPAPTMDLTALQTMAFGDESLIKDILQQFIDDSKADLSAFQSGIKNKDYDRVMELAHRLAGRTGQVGALPLSARFRKLELGIREQQVHPTAAESSSLAKELKAVIVEVENKIGQEA